MGTVLSSARVSAAMVCLSRDAGPRAVADGANARCPAGPQAFQGSLAVAARWCAATGPSTRRRPRRGPPVVRGRGPCAAGWCSRRRRPCTIGAPPAPPDCAAPSRTPTPSQVRRWRPDCGWSSCRRGFPGRGCTEWCRTSISRARCGWTWPGPSTASASSSREAGHTAPGQVLRDAGCYTRLVDRRWRIYRYTTYDVYGEPGRIVAVPEARCCCCPGREGRWRAFDTCAPSPTARPPARRSARLPPARSAGGSRRRRCSRGPARSRTPTAAG
jgi:hypothetical protein